MVAKLLPIRPDPQTQDLRSGGRYLFGTYQQARDYFAWMRDKFVLDGQLFFDRPYFLSPDCRPWKTVGAHDFSTLDDDRTVMRTERWQVSADAAPLLAQRWPEVRALAAKRGLASVWLLYDPVGHAASIVSYANRTGLSGTTDGVGLAALEAAPSMGAPFADQGWEQTLDLTQWVFTIWFPNPSMRGDTGRPSLWPNSPVLPEPTATDGVCEPSRGETGFSAPKDCTPHCGDGRRDSDEDNKRCPSDVPYF